MKPLIDFDAPEYNLEQPLLKRVWKLAQKHTPAIGGILLATALLTGHTLSRKNQDFEKTQQSGADVSLVSQTNYIIPMQSPIQQENYIPPPIIKNNPAISGFLIMFGIPLDENDTNETMYEKVSAVMELLQSSEYNSEASIERFRGEIRERLNAGSKNTYALMRALEILKIKQEITEELLASFNSIKNVDEIGKINEALTTYYEKSEALGTHDEWKALVKRIEEEYDLFRGQESKKRKTSNKPQRRA